MARLFFLFCVVLLASCALTKDISPKIDPPPEHLLSPEAVAAGQSTPMAVQTAAKTEQESAGFAGAPVPAAAQQPQSIQPPLQPAAKPSVASDGKLVMQTIQDWLRAWMKQDVEAYLAFYAKEFKTPNNEPRSKWEQTRRTRVLQGKNIEIRLNSLRLQVADRENAAAIFHQDYRSDSYGDKVIKELTFIKENGVWRIRQERVVKANVLPQER